MEGRLNALSMPAALVLVAINSTLREAFMSTPKNARGHEIDWLISNLRWLLLISVVLVLILDVFINKGGILHIDSILPQLILLGVAAFYNLGVMLLLSYDAPPSLIPALTLFLDTVLTTGFVVTSGGLTSSLMFFTLFPILTAALRFPWVVSLIIAIAVITSSGLASYSLTPQENQIADLVPFAATSSVLLLAALIGGLVGDRMKRAIMRKRLQEKEEEMRKLHAARERARLIFELASTLSATLNYNKVLQAVLEVGEKGMLELGRKESAHVGLVMLFRHNSLRIVASRHLPPRDRKARFEGKDGALAKALEMAEAVIIDNPGEDPELKRLIAMHGCKQAIVVPLRAGFENFGAVIFGSPQPNTYQENLRVLLVAICNQAIVALQNAQLYQSLRAEKEQIVEVEEDARKKLARDLHDGPTQSIASIAMRVNFVQTLLKNGGDARQLSQELKQIEDLARRTTKEIRHMLFTLRPLILETQGLRAALEQYISKLSDTEPISIHLEAPPKVDRVLDQDAQGVIFYIIEEAIGNARKHAQSEKIWVRLKNQENSFIAEVEDNGAGFDVDAVQLSYDKRGSLGLVNMQERADLVGGRLNISSAPGEGTRIRLIVPVDR